MLVLGIDPGVRKLGYSLVDFNDSGDKKIVDAGILLNTQETINRRVRRHKIYEISWFFDDMLSRYSIDKVGIEKLYFTSRNQSNAEFVYGMRGVLINKLISKGIGFVEIDPVQVKAYITGNGKADKKLVQKKIMQLYNLEQLPKYNDSADALGMAYIASKMV